MTRMTNFTPVNPIEETTSSEASPSTLAESRTSLGRNLLAAGALGALGFVVLIAIGGALTDGYNHSSQMISELAARGAEHSGLQTVAFMVVGVGVLCYAAGLHLVGRVPAIATTLVAVFGLLSSFAQAALPCDQGCEPTTATGTAHIITGASGFVAMLIAMFILARHWRRSEAHVALARSTRIYAWGGLAGLLAFNVTRGAELQSVDGLAQRAFAFCVIAWIVTTAATLRRLTEHPEPSI